MAKRLTDRFDIGEGVEIWFERIDHWIPGVIDRHQYPAVWVRTIDGREWFVTNGSRIRHIEQSATPRAKVAEEKIEDRAT